MLPDPPARFVERPALFARCDPMQRHLTMIQAPAGFGKTTLLAAVCRRRREADDVVAWLTLDEGDGPLAFASQLGLAFAEAGLALLESADETDSGSYLVDVLMHSVRVHRADCVLALDDAHVLRDAETVALLDRLLSDAPPNLHFALAMREIPATLDLASFVFEGRGEVITADDLRFQQRDIAKFFGGRLPRSDVADLVAASHGWPIALGMLRNVGEATSPAHGYPDAPLDTIMTNWIDARLWQDLSPQDQDLVIDAGQFDWIDREIVDEVLGFGSFGTLRTIPALQGLVQPIGAEDDALVIHPLIRTYCRERRYRETPEQYRAIHARIADAFARHGQVVPGMRHAHEADDPRQAGRILEEADGFALWLRYGLQPLRQVNALLTEAVLRACPRLWLIRCLELTLRGEIEQATTAYVNLGAVTNGFTLSREGGEDPKLQFDHLAFQFVLSSCQCRPLSAPTTRTIVEAIRQAVDGPIADPVARGAMCDAMCWVKHMRGNLDDARDWAERAIVEFGNASAPYLRTHLDLQIGSIAMAQGRVEDALESYAVARKGAASDILRDTGPSVFVNVLAAELDIERVGYTSWQHLHRMPTITASSGSLDIYHAATEAWIARAMHEGDPAMALDRLDEIGEYAAGVRLDALSRCVAAMRVSLLVAAGRAVEAQHAWTSSGFPERPEEIALLHDQTWREMESIACARLQLLIAEHRFDAARELAEALLGTVRDKGLRRTEMRGLAMAMVVEHAAGMRERARARLIEYLELYRETSYARSLILERTVVLDILEGLDDRLDPDLQSLAASAARLLREGPPRDPEGLGTVTPQERQILGLLERLRNKEIANELGLSEDGVRYHLKKIYRKIGVNNRFEAVRWAHATGVL